MPRPLRTPKRRWLGALAALAALAVAIVAGGLLRCHVTAPDAPAASPETSWSFGGLPPGAEAFGAELVEKLQQTWALRDEDYQPRTKHLRTDGTPKYTNRLFLESSPYLRQHAHNPVNWHPWGDEAFSEARRLGRPVFLSVGYSTCHWCHVMEEESFEDEEIAGYLNTHYVAIKVDREERPDVDAIYMSAVQMLTGGGGWPMSVWLTPDRKPFHGGTYFPARDGDRGSRLGFFTLLQKLRAMYDEQPDRIAESAKDIAERIGQSLASGSSGGAPPGPDALARAFEGYRDNFDDTWGGLGRAPKFPSSLPNRFLLRHHRRSGDPKALAMARLTLEKMAAGGMYDHVGGGFHRYSTDAHWLVPHFEKMLYDNALLTLAYLEGWQATGEPHFAGIAREILRYVERDMTSPDGAFYSATDADSPTPSGRREEGWFFTWTPDEIDEVVGAERGRIVKVVYAVTARGNFERRNILYTPRPLDEVASDLGLSREALDRDLAAAREQLYRARNERPPPLRDDKILTAWNGLMISAHAVAALALAEPRYAARAARAADFVLAKLRKDGRLLRSYKDGKARFNGYLDDYAFLVGALIDLYEATGETRWLTEARALDQTLERFYADPRGGWFMTSSDHEPLLAREKPGYDGAEPSGNSVHALSLLRLYELTTDDHYRARAEKALSAFAPTLERSPARMSEMLLALDWATDAAKEVVLVVPERREQAEPLLARLRQLFLPNRILVVAAEGDDLRRQSQLVPLLEHKVAKGAQPTAYVCERKICELPTTDPEVFEAQLRKVRKP